ncbi:AraC family transcriptional regulator [Lactobacillus brevis] [Lactiplantibacillus mudanjiangensis]|uniref:zinc ribbon domain-containing protein n=1 Tax=Lactiplantibacillus mudanjiangensis TaxID=1296538 RepID=UPI0010152211|nr:zinc ribbon domain-containing protein [Lactiplantibacillus mudanjiangensis]VDG20412.1 AraC family transcriptional regulator [Lactobacillus brevis] [Lactiplantibacillus mudanjiangensis]VDG30837.1 AraC family transcriptional regulator [Lactobacillus brevis] [Lactiplantibacillus mudanjiangensis]
MKKCIACGMPMRQASDFAQGNPDLDYCKYCTRPDGRMCSFEENQHRLVNLMVKTQGLDRAVAVAQVDASMRQLPAWQAHYQEEDR